MNKVYIILLGIVCFFLWTSFFLIQEGERGILLRFGKIVKDHNREILIYKPGFHYKLSLLDTVKTIDSKIQTTEHRSHIFIAKEKKDFIIDFYINWKIDDLRKYYLFAQENDNYRIEILLKRKLNDILCSEIKKLSKNSCITDEINSFNKKKCKQFDFYSFIFRDTFLKSFFLYQNTNILTKKNIEEKYISFEKLMNTSSIINLGINIVDISIKQITLSAEELHDTYNRMKLDNELFSKSEILKGQVIAKKIKSQADFQVIKILSNAKRKELVIQGESEDISMRLLSSIFVKEPNFYRFFRTFQAYKNIFRTGKDLIIMNPDNYFFRYMKHTVQELY
jgi:modulator of FtsH protease HflC